MSIESLVQIVAVGSRIGELGLCGRKFRIPSSQISADPRGSAIKLSRVLRVVEMSLVSVAMPVPMFVTVLVVVSMFVIVRVLMPVFVIMVSVVMFVAVLGGVSVFMIVLMVVFVFFAHGFVIPSNEIRLILACLHHR